MASDGSDSKGSDINTKTALPKSEDSKKMPTSLTNDDKKLDNKLSTKMMIIQALTDLNGRKAVSMHAIKKYMAERYNVDTEKIKYQIKKSIASAVNEGSILQIKGTGATGSFKLAPVKEQKPKEKKSKKEKTDSTNDAEKKKEKSKETDTNYPEKKKEKSKETVNKRSKPKEKSKKPEGKSLKSKVAKASKQDKPVKPKKTKTITEKKPKEKKDGGEKVKRGRKPKPPPSPKKIGPTRRERYSSASRLSFLNPPPNEV